MFWTLKVLLSGTKGTTERRFGVRNEKGSWGPKAFICLIHSIFTSHSWSYFRYCICLWTHLGIALRSLYPHLLLSHQVLSVLSHLQSYGHCHGSGPSLGSSDLGLGIRRDWSKVEATYSPILVTTEAGLRVKHSWSPCPPAWPWAISLPLAPLGSHVVSEPDPPVGPVYLFSIIPITSFPAICPVIGSWFRDHQLSGKSEPQERLTQSLATMEVPEGLKWPVLVLRCSVLAVF